MRIVQQFVSFGLVGAVATFVHVSVGLGLHHGLGIGPLWANLIAFCCALGTSYSGQIRFTFPGLVSHGAAFARFATVMTSGLALNQAIVWIVTVMMGFPYWASLVVILLTVPGLTFLLLKFWALRH